MKKTLFIIFLVHALGQFLAYGETKKYMGSCPGPGCPANYKQGWFGNCSESEFPTPNNSHKDRIESDAKIEKKYEDMGNDQLYKEKERLEKNIKDILREQEIRVLKRKRILEKQESAF